MCRIVEKPRREFLHRQRRGKVLEAYWVTSSSDSASRLATVWNLAWNTVIQRLLSLRFLIASPGWTPSAVTYIRKIKATFLRRLRNGYRASITSVLFAATTAIG